MKRVIIESPYAGDAEANMSYLEECLRDIALRDEEHAWWGAADLVVFYCDLGWSPGMLKALRRCKVDGKPFALRQIRLPAGAHAEGEGRCDATDD